MEQPEVAFKAGDRVRRADGAGPLGTVERIRIETVRETIKVDDTEPPSVTVTVLWDNGTTSHFVPNGLAKV